MDTDSFVLSVNTNYIIKDSKNLEVLFDFSNLNKNQELFSNKNKKVIGKFKNLRWKLLKVCGLIDLFVYKVRCMHSNVVMIVKIN